MTQKIKAIVVRSNDAKEKDVNVLLFSIENGKVWATLKGVKSPNAKMKAGKNLFTFGEFILEDGKAGKIVTSVEVVESFHEICEDLDKFFEGSAMLEVVERMEFSSAFERAQVFMLLVKCLKILCFQDAKSLYVLDKFLIEIFNICGCPLFSNKCTCCGSTTFDKIFVNYAVGELVCVSCKTPSCEELSMAVFSALRILSEIDVEKVSSLKLAKASELELLKVLVKNFERRFDTRLKMIGILA